MNSKQKHGAASSKAAAGKAAARHSTARNATAGKSASGKSASGKALGDRSTHADRSARTSANLTKPEPGSPKAYVESLDSPRRRAEGLILLDFFQRVTGLQPVLWGSSIIGYGRYHYRYASGREGDYLLTGFSPRKAALTIYIMPGYQDYEAILARLGKHRLGKSCLYIASLDDVDLDVLAELVRAALAYMRANYETFDA